MPPTYADFLLTISGAVGAYSVTASGPGEVGVTTAFAYHETPDTRALLDRIREGKAPTRQEMETLGTTLYDALFPRSISRAFDRAQAALPPDTTLRLKLNVQPPELNDLPWELLYDSDERRFLAGRLSFPIVRFIESSQPVASLLAPHPLRVLYVHANPAGTDQLDLAVGEAALREALRSIGEVTALHAATADQVRNALRDQPGYHILHYDGHAAFDDANTDGYLVLHNSAGGKDPLTGERLANHLDGTTIRLVVLAACETSTNSRSQRFSGIAQRLMHASRLPAVVANQWSAFDDSTIAFIRGFYGALADNYPVDAAVVAGRQAILDMNLEGEKTGFEAVDWATPVLFMRSRDGNIFQEQLSEEGAAMTDDKGHDGGIRFGDSASVSGDVFTGGKRTVNTGGGSYLEGGVNTGGGDFVGGSKNVHGDEVRGDKISVGNISGSQGVAIGRNATATVTGSSISGDVKIDAQQLRAALNELWDALDQTQLPRDQKRTATTVASVAIDSVKDDEVDSAGVVENVKKIGETIKQANVVVEQGSSLWQSVQKLAPLLGPLVGGARVVAGWFGVAL